MNESPIASGFNQLPSFPNFLNKSKEKTKVVTHTGEDSQPTRIYFQVFKQKTVLGVFKKLRCLSYERQAIDGGLGWRWLYQQEAKRLKFPYSYSKIDKEAHPIVLGDFFFPSPDLMYLDVRSFERGIQAINFFSKRINPRAAKVTKIQIVNRLFSIEEKDVEKLLQPPYDHFFEGSEIVNNQEKFGHLLQDIEENQTKKEESVEQFLSQMKESSPEIEEIDFDQGEEGSLEMLKLTLSFKNVEAVQHFHGNDQFSQWDLVQALAENLQELVEEKITQNDEEE